jgi:hypothetical protein
VSETLLDPSNYKGFHSYPADRQLEQPKIDRRARRARARADDLQLGVFVLYPRVRGCGP